MGTGTNKTAWTLAENEHGSHPHSGTKVRNALPADEGVSQEARGRYLKVLAAVINITGAGRDT
jgi:hypothetical protein